MILARFIYSGTHRFVDVEASPTKAEVDAIAAEQTEISCDDGCNIQFTSGSTGRSKATLISHKSLVTNSKEVRRKSQNLILTLIALQLFS